MSIIDDLEEYQFMYEEPTMKFRYCLLDLVDPPNTHEMRLIEPISPYEYHNYELPDVASDSLKRFMVYIPLVHQDTL